MAPQRNTLSTRLTSYLDSISDNAAPVPLAVSLTDSLQATMLVPADKPAGQGTNAAFADTELSAPDWQLTFREGTSDRDFAFGHGNAVGLTQIADVAGFGVPGIGNTSAASPVLSLATGGVFAGMGQGVGESARLSFAFQQSADDAIGESAYDARALTFGATVKPGRGLRLGAAATYLSEDAGALGSIGSGAFSMESDEYATQSLTMSADYAMTPDLTVSGAFTTARTTQATGASAFSLNGPVRSEAMSLGLAKTDLFAANDRLTVTVSQPLRVSKGSTTLRLGDRLDAAGNLLYRDHDVGLEPDGRQIDFQVGYETATANGVSFSAGAYFTRDDAQVKGETDAGAVASINLKF